MHIEHASGAMTAEMDYWFKSYGNLVPFGSYKKAKCIQKIAYNF